MKWALILRSGTQETSSPHSHGLERAISSLGSNSLAWLVVGYYEQRC